MTLPITTDRLLLRRYTDADVPDLLALVPHPSVARATPEIEATEDGIKEYVHRQNSYQPFEKDRCFDLAIARRDDDRVMGLLTLICRDHRRAELGYALGAPYRGRGYATEAAAGLVAYAFTTLGLHRIQAETDSANAASWRVMERLGMQREGVLREAVYEAGTWLDTFIYGLLAREWQGAG